MVRAVSGAASKIKKPDVQTLRRIIDATLESGGGDDFCDTELWLNGCWESAAMIKRGYTVFSGGPMQRMRGIAELLQLIPIS